jgi:hypothetical protein
MTDRKYKCSVNSNWLNKDFKNDQRDYKYGFKNYELTATELVEVIHSYGYAISYQFDDEIRQEKNFLCTDIVCVDVDNSEEYSSRNRSYEDALQDTLVADNALLIYTTTNHTSEQHRYRIVFGLPKLIIDASDIRALSTGLAIRLAGDLRAVDAARMFFGSKDCQGTILGNEYLDETLVNDLIRQGLDFINNKNSDTSGNKSKSYRSNRYIRPESLVKTAKGETVAIGTIKKNTSVFCPDHFDQKPSAFVGLSNKNDGRFLYCHVCRTPSWVGVPPNQYEFNSFDTAIKEKYSEKNNPSFVPNSPLGGLMFPYVVGIKRIQITATEKLQISKLHKPGVMFIKSPKGSGKTTILPEIMAPLLSNIKENRWTIEDFEESDESHLGDRPAKTSGETNYSVLLIGHRRSLIREMSKRLNLNCYLDDGTVEEEFQSNRRQRIIDRQKRYGICLDSLPKLIRDRYNLIIIDESEQVLSHFMSETLKSREYIFKRLERLLHNSSTIICLDADLSWLTFNTITELAPCKSRDLSEAIKKNKRSAQEHLFTDSKPVFIYLNEFTLKGKSLDIFQNKNHLIEDVITSLKQSKRIYIASNSKGQLERLEKAIQDEFGKKKKTRLITSANSQTVEAQDFIKEIKVEILNYDAVLASPSLSTGIDITFENDEKLVDVVYGFFENNITHHFEIDQQISRVRQPKEIKVWISPRNMSYETDISIVKADILRGNLVANVDVEVNEVIFEETVKDDDNKFLRLATVVEERKRASMNRLRTNFINYKQDQGYEVNFIETNKELSKSGLIKLKSASNAVWDQRVDAIINAPYIDQTNWIRILENFDSEILISSEELNSFNKSRIEFFFRQPICQADIFLDFVGYQQQILFLEKLMSLFTAPKTDLDRLEQEENERLIEKISSQSKAPRLNSVKDFRSKHLLLHLILTQTPIYEDGTFIKDRIFNTDDLSKFVKFVNAHKAAIETQLCPVRGDYKTKPVKQLGEFLKLIALKTMKSGTDQTNNDKKYLYRLDDVMIECNDEVINRRRDKTNDEYTTIYWKQVHKANNFETQIYQQARDYVGFKSDQKTYWMPLLGGPPSSKLRKSSKIYDLVKDFSG